MGHPNPLSFFVRVTSQAVLVTVLLAGVAAAQIPFACTGEAFVVQDRNAQLSQIDQTVSAFEFLQIGPPQGIEINSLGFRTTDGLLYGLQVDLDAGTTSQAIRIDSTGTVFPLGLPAGLPTNRGFNAGDVSSDGTRFFVAHFLEPNLYVVDLTAPGLPVLAVPISGPSGIVLDWAYNPADGKLYGGDRDGNGVAGQVARLDPVTGQRTDFNVSGLPAGAPTQYGGAWFDASGNLFLFENSGRIFEIDLGNLASPTPTIVRLQSGPSSGRNDATACIQDIVGAAKNMAVTADGLPETVTITYVFENLSAVEGLVDLSAQDDLTAVFGIHGVDWTFTSIASQPAGLANPAFDGHTDLELVNQAPTQSLAPSTSASVTVTLEVLGLDHLDANGQFCNQVLVTGTSSTGILFGDLSTAGLNPDPDGNGSAEERELTCIKPSPQESAAVGLVKTGTLDDGGDGVVHPGDLILYDFAVTNTGSVTLTGVSVTDPIVPTIACPSGQPIPSLAPGATEVCTGSYAVTPADIAAGARDNTATATGSDLNGHPVSAQGSHRQPLAPAPAIRLLKDGVLDVTGAPPPAAIELVKTGSLDLGADGVPTPGDVITYTLRVSNMGSVALSDVTVSDPLLGAVVCPSGNPIASLGPFESETCTGTYGITLADIDAGVRGNIAAVTATDPSGAAIGAQDSHSQPIPTFNAFECTGEAFIVQKTAAELSQIDQTVSPFVFVPIAALENPPGTPIEVNNLGFRTTDGLMYAVHVDLSGGSNIEIIQIDRNGNVTGLGRPAGLPASFPYNAGDVSADGTTMILTHFNDPNLWLVDLTTVPALSAAVPVVITGAGGGPPPGGVVLDWAYNPADGKLYGADRNGNGVSAQIAQLDPRTGERRDFLVPGLPGGSPLQYGGAWFNSGRLFVFLNSGTIFEIDLGNLASPTPTIVSSQSGPTSARNDAAACVPPTEVNPLVAFKLKGSKSTAAAQRIATKGAPPETVADLGDVISYTFEVTNTGNVPLTGVVVSDPMVSPIICPSGHPIPVLQPGESETCTGMYVITQADVDAGIKVNVATVTGEAPNGDPVEDGDSHDELIPQAPAIELLKTGVLDDGGDGFGDVGDVITYTFQVTNTGNVTLTSVSVSDPIVSAVTCPSGHPIPVMAPGASETCRGTYVLARADVDAGVRDNTATAAGTDPKGAPVSATGSHSEPIPRPARIVLTKLGALDVGPDGVANPGDVIHYTFQITNTGGVTLTDVVVSDPLVSSVSCPDGAPGTPDVIPSLAAGASVACSGFYVLTQVDVDRGVRNNVATVTGQDPSGHPVTGLGGHAEPVPQVPGIEIVKTGSLADSVPPPLKGVGGAMPGDVIDYLFEVSNVGNVTLTNVVVSDPLVPSIVCFSGNPIRSLSPGDLELCTGSYVVTQADIDLGQRANTATATGTPPIGPPVADSDSHVLPLAQASVCLPTVDFETGGGGAPLPAGTIVDNEFVALGMHVGTGDPLNHPAMIFDTSNPTGGDVDLGTPNEDFGGPGVGAGGGAGQPGESSAPLGKVLIISQDGNTANPDSFNGGGTLIFEFDVPVFVDSVGILDADVGEAGGTVEAFDGSGVSVGSAAIANLGDNSFQTVFLGVEGVRRLEVTLVGSGAVSGIVFCPDPGGTGAVGDRVWTDLDGDGQQDLDEPGINGVLVVLLDGNGDVVDSQITSGDGEYLFADLGPGTYTVAVDPSTLPAGLAQTFDLDGLATPDRATVSLASGDVRRDVDFGYTAGGDEPPGPCDCDCDDGSDGGSDSDSQSGDGADSDSGSDSDGDGDTDSGDGDGSSDSDSSGGNECGCDGGDEDSDSGSDGDEDSDSGSDGDGDGDTDSGDGDGSSDSDSSGGNECGCDGGDEDSDSGSDGDEDSDSGSDSDGDGDTDSGDGDGSSDSDSGDGSSDSDSGGGDGCVCHCGCEGDEDSDSGSDSDGDGDTDSGDGDGASDSDSGGADSDSNSDSGDGGACGDGDSDSGSDGHGIGAGGYRRQRGSGVRSPGKASVGGRVWQDLDLNGLRDLNEPGLGDVVVDLLDADGRVIASTLTGPTGDYRFDGLGTGIYGLAIDSGGLPSGFVACADYDGLDTPESAILSLVDGEELLRVDFGYESERRRARW